MAGVSGLEIKQLVENEEFMKSYRLWQEQPMTQRMAMIARRLARPVAPPDGPGYRSRCTGSLNAAAGANTVLDFTFELDVIALMARETELQETYQMDQALLEWGFKGEAAPGAAAAAPSRGKTARVVRKVK